MQNNSQPLTILLLGIFGLVLCQICSPIAWVMGNSYMKECAATGQPPDQLATIGRILGIVGTLLLGLSLIFVVLYIIFMFVLVGGAIATS
ncbi:MAG: hypothetical protein KIT72_06125 [Polyangiaceae bacterium]|nr:hypothetical protein [Polyangiaceae bacterium]MCW5789977.1 hypothetical protein [Polyangiaceae bacterium]